MAHIVAYHPEITVRDNDGQLFVIKLDLEDWYEDKEILQSLSEETGARTVGELVEFLRSRNNSVARIEKIKMPRTGRIIRKWDDRI